MLLQSCATRAKALVKLNSDRTSATPSTQVAAPTVIFSPTFHKFRFYPTFSINRFYFTMIIPPISFFLSLLVEPLTRLFLLSSMLRSLFLVPSSYVSFFIYIYLRILLYILSFRSVNLFSSHLFFNIAFLFILLSFSLFLLIFYHLILVSYFLNTNSNKSLLFL